MQEINLKILKYLNWLWEEVFFQNFVKIFVDAPIFIIPVFLLWYWIYYSYNSNFLSKNVGYEIFNTLQNKKKENLILITYWIIFWLIISLIIQQIVPINRPEDFLDKSKLLMTHLPDASFPSDHTTVWMAFLFWILFAWYKKYFLIFLLPITFMVISRIIAWVHWPFDILAGTFVWLFSSYITFSHISKNKFVKKINLEIIKLLKYIKL